MSISALLDELNKRDVRLSTHGEKLIIDAPKGVLSDELRHTLLQHKADLIATLKAANDPAQPSTSTRVEIPADLVRFIRAMGEYWHYSDEDYETAFEGARFDPSAWRVLCLEDQRRFGWQVPKVLSPGDIEQAVTEAVDERRAILEHEAKLSAERADTITKLAADFYRHLFGVAFETGCCKPRCNAYCAEDRRLHDAYCGETS